MIIAANPVSLFTFRFEVLLDQALVGSFRHRAGRTSTAIIGDSACLISRSSFNRWDLIPETGGRALATVEKAPKGRYDISWPGGKIALIRSFLGFRWEIVDLSGLVGAVRLNNLFSRSLRAETKMDIPAGAAVLLMWTIVKLRRRTVTAAAGGAG